MAIIGNYETVAIRNLIGDRLYSAINIGGLAVSLAAAILIVLFVHDELSFDRWIADSDRIYRVEVTFNSPGRAPRRSAASMGPVREALERDFAVEIETATRLFPLNSIVRHDDRSFAERIGFVDAGFFDVFEIPFIEGGKENALADTRSLVISRAMALKYFGSGSALGKTLTFDNTLDYRITAVIEDLPRNTHLFGSTDFIALFESSRLAAFPINDTAWRSAGTYTYLKLRSGVAVPDMASRFPDFMDRNVTFPPNNPYFGARGSENMLLHLNSIRDIRLRSDSLFELTPPTATGGIRPTGTLGLVLSLIAVAILIVAISSINFVNLATAKATERAREVAMRKVLGASRRQLIVQFLTESAAIVLFALIAALAMVELALPWFNQFTGKALEISYTDSALPYFLFAAMIFIVGGLSGLYPAFVLSGFRPALTLRANQSSGGGRAGLRSLLILLQFSIAIGLIISTAVIYSQTNFARNLEPGFEKKDITIVRLLGLTTPEQFDQAALLAKEIRRLPGVVSSGISGVVPGDGYGNSIIVGNNVDGRRLEISLNANSVGPGLFETYEIRPLVGRLFSEEFAGDETSRDPGETEELHISMILNRSAVQAVGFDSPEAALDQILELAGTTIPGQNGKALARIVGVVPDIRWGSARDQVTPMIFFHNPNFFGAISVKSSAASFDAVQQRIERLWRDFFPEIPISKLLLAENLESQYLSEDKIFALFGSFALLALMVSCLGLYGSSYFSASRRTKEIGIRKVLGAGVSDIVKLLLLQFSRPVVIANFVAWPVAWYFMRGWLDGFVYRIDLSVFYFLGAGVLTLMIAWTTVGIHAARVARANPIHALKYE